MDLAGLAAQCGVTPNADGAIDTQCLKCGGKALLWVAQTTGKLWARCEDQCGKLDPETLLEALADDFAARQVLREPGDEPDIPPEPERPPYRGNGGGNGHVVKLEDDPKQALLSWQLELTYGIKQALTKPTIKNWLETDPAGLRANMVDSFKANGIPPALQTLSPADIESALVEVVSAYVPVPVAPQEVILSEDYELALAENELYLSRQEIVEQLYYAQSISLFVGGKHHGKSTAVRTLAMSIPRGLPFLGRKTSEGHVIYGASAEEVPVARMELLNMGWQQNREALNLVYANPDAPNQDDERDRVLEQIAKLAIKRGTIFIVLDMLFDFARIRDEMSYAGTREAIGKIQRLADITKAHVLATHHTPKYMLDTHSAATAALGSQGIAARFSPILLSRSWGANIYTIESTMTRDPRGKELEQTVVTKNDQGWIESQGEFKESMKWPLYEKRILDLMEGADEDKKFTVIEISRTLEVTRPHIQMALKKMWELGKLRREKYGVGFRYWKEGSGSPEER